MSQPLHPLRAGRRRDGYAHQRNLAAAREIRAALRRHFAGPGGGCRPQGGGPRRRGLFPAPGAGNPRMGGQP